MISQASGSNFQKLKRRLAEFKDYDMRRKVGRMMQWERRALRRAKKLNAKEQLKSSKDTRLKSILTLIKAYGISFVENKLETTDPSLVSRYFS